MRRSRRNRVQDSDESSSESEDSDSDATVCKKQPPTIRKRGKPVARKNAKRQRVQNASDSDSSQQPSTSGTATSQTLQNTSDNSSESESVDSDYGPMRDKEENNLSQRRGRQLKKVDSTKKRKGLKNSVNGVSPDKGPRSRNNLNASNKKVNSHKRPESQPNRKSISNDAPLNPKEVENLAQKLVYFLFIEDQKKYAIKKRAITAHVFKDETYSSKLYVAVINKANFILKKTFGMELMEVENQKDSYLIVNILGRELGMHDYVEVSRLKQQQHGLILYLLSVIFMNGNVITEDELTKSLKPLGIDLTSKKLHPIFGDVKKYITFELVKQMYLNYECISKDPPNYEITWGIRAKQEFDKRDLLKFVCQIMDNSTPENWRIQYKDAEKSANPKANSSN